MVQRTPQARGEYQHKHAAMNRVDPRMPHQAHLAQYPVNMKVIETIQEMEFDEE